MKRWMYWTMALIAGWHLIALGWVAQNRLSYSAIVDESENMHARCAYTVSIGEDLYGPVSHTIQRKDYTPLSFQIQGFVIKFFGLDIRWQRLTALLFGLGSLLLLGLTARNLTGSRFWGWMAAGLFAGIDVPFWFMEIGPQPMHVFFALFGLWLLVRDTQFKWRTMILVSLALFACFWSKQTGLAYIAAGCFYGFTRDWRKGMAMSGLSALLIALGCWWHMRHPDSNFWFSTVYWITLDPIEWGRIFTPVLFPEMLGRFGISLALILAGATMLPGRDIRRFFRPELIFLAVAVLAGNFARLKWGSGVQQVIVGYGMILLCGIVFLGEFLKKSQIAPVVATVLICVQGLALLHDFAPALITEEDQRRFEQVNRILATPGKTTKFCLMGYNNYLVGKTMYMDPFVDSVRRKQTGEVRATEDWERFLETRPWDILIVGYPLEYNVSLMAPMLQNGYRLVQDIPQAVASKPYGVLRQRLLVFEKK